MVRRHGHTRCASCWRTLEGPVFDGPCEDCQARAASHRPVLRVAPEPDPGEAELRRLCLPATPGGYEPGCKVHVLGEDVDEVALACPDVGEHADLDALVLPSRPAKDAPIRTLLAYLIRGWWRRLRGRPEREHWLEIRARHMAENEAIAASERLEVARANALRLLAATEGKWCEQSVREAEFAEPSHAPLR